MAEREGFEPSEPARVHLISSQARSASSGTSPVTFKLSVRSNSAPAKPLTGLEREGLIRLLSQAHPFGALSCRQRLRLRCASAFEPSEPARVHLISSQARSASSGTSPKNCTNLYLSVAVSILAVDVFCTNMRVTLSTDCGYSTSIAPGL